MLDMLLEILEGEAFSHTVIAKTLKKHQGLEQQERAFMFRLCTGTVKVYMTIDYVINCFASLPVNKMKPVIRNVLRLSVYQLLYMDQVPVSAVCNEAVKLAKKRGFKNLSGFVNGLLRNIVRKQDQISYPDQQSNSLDYLSICYSVPRWLVSQLLEQYNFDTVETMLRASLREKEITIRCNRSKVSPASLIEGLEGEGVTVNQSVYLDYAFKIKDFDYLEKLEAFQKGLFSVQDISSMLVGEVAGYKENDYVIDVCAAPGGKTLHAAERAGMVSARDLTEYKVQLINQNKQRLDMGNIQVKVWDATILDTSAVQQADVVIADLPCSGLGVLGKKMDIKYNLKSNQLEELVQLQRKILGIVQNYVKPGGILIYSTCTVNQKENIDNRNWFLEQFHFTPEKINSFLPESLQRETTKEGYLQLIQGVDDTDGFFLCKMRKQGE